MAVSRDRRRHAASQRARRDPRRPAALPLSGSVRYQAQLGPPWFVLFGAPVYYPPALFWWWYFYEAYAPPIFAGGGIIAASGGFIAIAVAIGTSVWRAREARNVATYGSARWAEKSEIREAGLLDPDGVVLGRFEKDYLRHDGPEHVLCFAPNPHEGMDL